MTKKLLLVWILVNGLAAVLLSSAGLFFETDHRALGALLPFWLSASFVVVTGFFGAPLLSMLLPGLVLRKLKPNIPLTIWVLGSLVYVILYIGAIWKAPKGLPRFESELYMLTHRWNDNWADVLTLPWHVFAVEHFLLPLALWTPTALALWYWRRSRNLALRFGLALAAGSFLQVLFRDVLESLSLIPESRFIYSRGIESLSLRDGLCFAGIFLTACCGAVVSGLLLTASSNIKPPVKYLRLLAAGIVTLCIIGPFAYNYGAGQQGFAAGFPQFQKFMTAAPLADVTVGKPIVTLLNTADIRTPRYLQAPTYSLVHFEPSGRAFLTFDEARNLVTINPMTGNIEHMVAGPFGKDDYFSFAWTRDGKFLLLRSGVKESDDAFGVKGRMTSRIRVYNVPDYTLASDRLAPVQCPVSDVFNPPVEMQSEQTFIMRCEPFSGVKADTPEMIRVPIDGSRAIERIDAGVPPMQGWFQKIVNSRTGPLVVRVDAPSGKGTSVWLQELEGSKGVRRFERLSDRTVAGGTTFQFIEQKGSEFMLRFCGSFGDVSDPPAGISTSDSMGFCRSIYFDDVTLAFLRLVDDPVGKPHPYPRRKTTRQVGDLSIESEWDDKSKTGSITVSDVGTGAMLQHLTTKNQSIIAVSPDKKLMVTHAFDEAKLQVYRIDAAAK
jgi:hypothetical protein